MPDPDYAPGSDDQLLVDIQAAIPGAAEHLESRFGDYLKRVASSRVRVFRLAADEVGDIVQAVFVRVLDPTTSRFCPTRCTARRFLGGLAFNAAKAIQIQSRNRWDRGGADRGVNVRTLRVLMPVGVTAAPPHDHETEGEDLLDQLPGPQENPCRRLQTDELFGSLLEGEGAFVARIVRDHFLGDIDIQDVATSVGRSRFQTSRDLSRFYARARNVDGLRLALRTAI